MSCKFRSPKDMVKTFLEETGEFWGVVFILVALLGWLAGSVVGASWLFDGVTPEWWLSYVSAIWSGIVWAFLAVALCCAIVEHVYKITKNVLCEPEEK